MKRFLVTILALAYLSTSVGATVHMHYCMDKLVFWSFGNEKSGKNSCPDCGMEKTATDKQCGKQCKSCCQDEHKIIKLENDQKVSETYFQLPQITGEAITPVFGAYSFTYGSSLTEEYPLTHAPPRTQNTSLHVLNCVFRI